MAQCSLWLHHADGRDELLIEAEKLSLDILGQPRRTGYGSVLYLDFIDPLDIAELTAFLVQEQVDQIRGQREAFHPRIGRLARVGYGSRLVAAAFALSLLLRGRVPGDTAAAAAIACRRMRQQRDELVYYGRVIRDRSGWTILQYWYFYPFNNWRSGFYGANDHEADWEMVAIYLYQGPDGDHAPRWIAYSSHDYQGSDLRRRWDDRDELTLKDSHPVAHVAAGSHSNYFRPGDYLAEIEILLLAPLAGLLERLRRFWVETLHQSGVEAQVARWRVSRIPFVDYARGDGLSVGPGQERAWTPVLLDPLPDWVSEYRGLWGFYAQDPFAGENSPSGPMYERSGEIRRSWADLIGWAGLDGVPTPLAEGAALERRSQQLLERQREIDAKLAEGLAQLQATDVDLSSMLGYPHLSATRRRLEDRRRDLRRETTALRREQDETGALLEAIEDRLACLARGEADDPRAHIHNLAAPVPEPGYRLRRLAEIWSAISITALVLGVLLLFVAEPEVRMPGLLILAVGFLFVDALLRQQLESLVSHLAVFLAILSGLILLKDFFIQIAIVALVLAMLYLAWENVREVFR